MGRENGDQDIQKGATGTNKNTEKSNLLVVKETQNNVIFKVCQTSKNLQTV